jgi:hypothetical protein
MEHPASFSEDDLSPLRAAIDPLWDDTSADDSSTGDSPGDAPTSRDPEGEIPSRTEDTPGGLLPGELPIWQSLAAVLPLGSTAGIFTLDDGEEDLEALGSATAKLPLGAPEVNPTPAPARRVSYGMVRGSNCSEGADGSPREPAPRRASEPGTTSRNSREISWGGGKFSRAGDAPPKLSSSDLKVSPQGI